jgi:mannose-6-phosphate isomerase
MPSSPRLVPVPHVSERPWGSFELLALNEPISVKIITVHPGHRLSLQRHEHRDEWWTALDAPLYAEIDGVRTVLRLGGRLWIPRGTNHRVGNDGPVPARFLELAFGRFAESDIERLADDYQRVPASDMASQ